MKISEKQIVMLLDIVKETLKDSSNYGGYNWKTRCQLVNDVMNQQSNDLKELDPNNLRVESDPASKKSVMHG